MEVGIEDSMIVGIKLGSIVGMKVGSRVGIQVTSNNIKYHFKVKILHSIYRLLISY